jgi:hypothetical protein
MQGTRTHAAFPSTLGRPSTETTWVHVLRICLRCPPVQRDAKPSLFADVIARSHSRRRQWTSAAQLAGRLSSWVCRLGTADKGTHGMEMLSYSPRSAPRQGPEGGGERGLLRSFSGSPVLLALSRRSDRVRSSSLGQSISVGRPPSLFSKIHRSREPAERSDYWPRIPVARQDSLSPAPKSVLVWISRIFLSLIER